MDTRNAMIRYVLIIAFAGSVAFADKYKSCPGYPDTGILKDAAIGNCTAGKICKIHVGANESFYVDFVSARDSQTLEVDIYGIIPGVPVPLPFVTFDTNGCNPLYNIHCPLVKNNRYKYKNSVIVPGYQTPFSLQGMFQMKDDMQNTIVCFLVDVIVIGDNDDTYTENLIL